MLSFKQFLAEQPYKKRLRFRNGKWVPVKNTRSNIHAPSSTYPEIEPVSNLERTSVDFDPQMVGRVARPRRRTLAGERPVPVRRRPNAQPVFDPRKTDQISPKLPKGLLKKVPTVYPPIDNPEKFLEPQQNIPLEPLGPGPMEPEQPVEQPVGRKQILAIANAAKASGNLNIINDILELCGEAQDTAQSRGAGSRRNRYLMPFSSARAARVQAQEIATQIKQMPPQERAFIWQELQKPKVR